MPFVPWSRANDYQAPPPPLRAVITEAIWNAVMADLAARLRVVEGRDLDYQAIIDQLVDQALDTVSASLTQEIEAGRAELEEVREAFEELQAGGFQAERIKMLLAGSSATNVQEAIDVLAARIAILPKPTLANAGKVPIINAAGTGYDLGFPRRIPTLPRNADVTLTSEDSGKWINFTANSFNQSFAAVAALGVDWFCYLQNSGDGDVTLDPAGAETIDGLGSFVMYPGEIRIVRVRGSGLVSTVLAPFNKRFTTSDTFVKPPGYRFFDGHYLSGGGGGGGGNYNTENSLAYPGGNGASGSYMFAPLIPAQTIAATSTVTIGAGGAPGLNGGPGGGGSYGTFGSAGGATSFAGLSVSGGNGGPSSSVGGGGTPPGAVAVPGLSPTGIITFGGVASTAVPTIPHPAGDGRFFMASARGGRFGEGRSTQVPGVPILPEAGSKGELIVIGVV